MVEVDLKPSDHLHKVLLSTVHTVHTDNPLKWHEGSWHAR